MYQSQQPTLKPWKPPTSAVLLIIFKKYKTKWLAPHELVDNLDIMQHSISMAMINLQRRGLLDRKSCQCGRGFVYKINKEGLLSA